MNKIIIAIVVLLVIIGGVAYFTGQKQESAPPTEQAMEGSPVASCDLNEDGRCDATDVQLFESAIGKCLETFSTVADVRADADGDGCVTEDDKQAIFPAPPPATSPPTSPASPPPASPTAPPPATPTTPPATSPPPATAQVKTFSLTGQNFSFSQTEIRVKKGDTVKVNFESTGGFHDWSLDTYNVSTTQVNTGGKASVQFVADKSGTFEYYCSVGSHRALGMTGKLIVE